MKAGIGAVRRRNGSRHPRSPTRAKNASRKVPINPGVVSSPANLVEARPAHAQRLGPATALPLPEGGVGMDDVVVRARPDSSRTMISVGERTPTTSAPMPTSSVSSRKAASGQGLASLDEAPGQGPDPAHRLVALAARRTRPSRITAMEAPTKGRAGKVRDSPSLTACLR